MNSKMIADGILRAVAVIAVVLFICYFFFKISTLLIYITIAVIISLIGRPVVVFLKTRLKMRNTLSVITTMVLFLGIVMGVVSMFIPLLIKQGQNLSLLNIDALQQNLENLYHEVTNYFGITSVDIRMQLRESKIFSKINFGVIPEFLNSVVSLLGSLSIGLFSVLFIAFFYLKDSKLLQENLMVLIPDDKEARLKKSLHTIKLLLSRYFGGLVLQISILFIIYTAVLLIFGIQNPVVIAFLCALLNIIPYLGPVISAFLMAMLTMTSNLGADFSSVILPKTVFVMIGFTIGQLVDNFFSQPFIFSNSVKSHPLEIFLIIIIGGLLFGVTGMIIAVPGYTVIKVILKEFFAENKIVKSLTKNI